MITTRVDHPEQRIGQERAVAQEQVGGIAAQLATVEQVEVAEDPVEHEGQRDRQEARVEFPHGLRRHRVQGVRGHGRRGDDRDHLVEEALAVLGEHRPMGGRRPVERQVFLPPLAERQEQGDQDRADHEPAGDVDVHGLGAGDGAEHEADGHRQHVEDHDVLEPERIRHEEHAVGERDHPEPQRQAKRRAEAHEQEHDGEGRRRAARQGARGDGAVPLHGVLPVLVHVGEVVDQVDRAGERAEDGEGRERRPDERAEEVLREGDRGEDEEVLHPLPRAQRGDGRAELTRSQSEPVIEESPRVEERHGLPGAAERGGCGGHVGAPHSRPPPPPGARRARPCRSPDP